MRRDWMSTHSLRFKQNWAALLCLLSS